MAGMDRGKKPHVMSWSDWRDLLAQGNKQAEANQRPALNQAAKRIPPVPKGAGLGIPPIPEGASRPMELARSLRIPPRPVAAEGAVGAAARGIASTAAAAESTLARGALNALRTAGRYAGPVGAALTVSEGLGELGKTRDNSPERREEDRRRMGQRGALRGFYPEEQAPPGGMPLTAAQIRRRAMADQIGREAEREYMERSAAGVPQEDVAAFRNQRAAQPKEQSPQEDVAAFRNQRAAQPEDQAPQEDVAAFRNQRVPPKPPRNPPRQAARRPTAPVESEADKLNAMELDRIMRGQATRRPTAPVESEADKLNDMEIDRIMRERVAESTGTMKKGGKVQAYKKGGGTDRTMKMAKGGAVRGCGIAQRGKTRGVMR